MNARARERVLPVLLTPSDEERLPMVCCWTTGTVPGTDMGVEGRLGLPPPSML